MTSRPMGGSHPMQGLMPFAHLHALGGSSGDAGCRQAGKPVYGVIVASKAVSQRRPSLPHLRCPQCLHRQQAWSR